MSIQSTKNYLDTFERDAGICQYCDEDLLWSYSIFESAKFDLIPAKTDVRVTCCEACYRLLEGHMAKGAAFLPNCFKRGYYKMAI